MRAPIGDVTLNAVLEVKRIRLTKEQLWKVNFHTYGGSLFDLILYTNGDEQCPFQHGDFYATEEGQHGGWFLIRLPQEEINQIKSERQKHKRKIRTQESTMKFHIISIEEAERLREEAGASWKHLKTRRYSKHGTTLNRADQRWLTTILKRFEESDGRNS